MALFTELVIFLAAAAAADDLKPALGHELKPNLGEPVGNIAGTIISPDGSGLPDGSGTAIAGKELYKVQCAACHGMDGQQAGNQIAGGIGTLATQRPLKTVGSYWPYATTLYDYIARAMPYNQQKTLSAVEVYALTAYVLNLNGILDDNAALNAHSLLEVSMPNQAGFTELIP